MRNTVTASKRTLLFLEFLFLTSLVSFLIGIFLFDRNLIFYKKIIEDETFPYTNYQNLFPLLKNSIFSFIGMTSIIIILSLFLKFRKGLPYLECLLRQSLTFLPLLLLSFGRLFYGKALRYIFYIPIWPSILLFALISVVHLNLVLHLDFNIFRNSRLLFQKHPLHIKKILPAILTVFLATLLVNHVIQKPHFQRFSGHKLFVGDEPKYLRMAYSLASDRDLDLTDDYIGDREEVESAKKELLESRVRKFGHFSVIGKNGGIYHFHMPGISFLILPAFLMDLSRHEQVEPDSSPVLEFLPKKLYLTRLWLLILGLCAFSLAARLIYRFFQSLFILAALLTIMILSSPVPDYMFQVYPELAAVLFSLLALNAILFPLKPDWLDYLFIAVGIGSLPWLHQRFILLSLGLYAALILIEIFPKKNYKKVLIISLLLLIQSLPYFYYFYSITGSPIPNSMYRMWGTTYTRAAIFPSGFFGLFFDYSSGFLQLFPWTILALTGIYWSLKLEPRKAAILLLVFIPYYALVCITPWHGIVEESTRMITTVIPLLLLFLGYLLKVLKDRPSYLNLFLLAACLILIFLNKKFRFFVVTLGTSVISPAQYVQIVGCFFIILFLYIFVFLSDKSAQKRWDLIPVKKISDDLKTIYRGTKASGIFKKTARILAFVTFFALSAYVLNYIKNWNDEALSSSLFGSLTRMNELNDFVLFRKGHSSIIFHKGDRELAGLIRNTYRFEINPDQGEKQLSLRTSHFYEKIPRGCYRVDLEMEGLSSGEAFVELDFLNEIRKLRLRETPKIARASTTYLLFQDVFDSLGLRIILSFPQPRKIYGRLKVYPVPCLVYGKDLIMRPSLDQTSMFTKREDQYNLWFDINTKGAKKRYQFLFYALKVPAGTTQEDRGLKALLASHSEEFIDQRRRRIEMEFRLSPDFSLEKSSLALFVCDEQGHPLTCKSTLLKTVENGWVLLESSDLKSP